MSICSVGARENREMTPCPICSKRELGCKCCGLCLNCYLRVEVCIYLVKYELWSVCLFACDFCNYESEMVVCKGQMTLLISLDYVYFRCLFIRAA